MRPFELIASEEFREGFQSACKKAGLSGEQADYLQGIAATEIMKSDINFSRGMRAAFEKSAKPKWSWGGSGAKKKPFAVSKFGFGGGGKPIPLKSSPKIDYGQVRREFASAPGGKGYAGTEGDAGTSAIYNTMYPPKAVPLPAPTPTPTPAATYTARYGSPQWTNINNRRELVGGPQQKSRGWVNNGPDGKPLTGASPGTSSMSMTMPSGARETWTSAGPYEPQMVHYTGPQNAPPSQADQQNAMRNAQANFERWKQNNPEAYQQMLADGDESGRTRQAQGLADSFGATFDPNTGYRRPTVEDFHPGRVSGIPSVASAAEKVLAVAQPQLKKEEEVQAAKAREEAAAAYPM